MKKLLFDIHTKRKELISKGIFSFTNEQLKDYETKYDEIMSLSKEENKNINPFKAMSLFLIIVIYLHTKRAILIITLFLSVHRSE